MGDSAGAGLLTSAIGVLQDNAQQLPEGVVMISPWLDLSAVNTSYETNQATDPVLSKAYMLASAYLYAGNNVDKANPAGITFRQFPPVLAMVGSTEILLDDSKHFLGEVETVQPHAVLRIYAHQNHVWPLSDIFSEASKLAMKEIRDFLDTL